MHKAIVLLGSNLGAKKSHITRAIQLLGEKAGKISKTSSLYETEPWGKASDNTYLNQAVEIETELPPLLLLDVTQAIETTLGRVRIEVWEDRVIDIDILLYGNLVLATPSLCIPHKELPNRNFALTPIVEIVPDWIHPTLCKTMQQLLALCTDKGEVKALKP